MRSYDDPHAVNYLIDEDGPDPVAGRVRADVPSIVWNGGMAAVAIAAGPFFLTPSALAIFLVTTGAALLFGHSLGYHRMMIHGSFKAPRWLTRTLVWFGAFVGMAGPYGIIRAHDTRDWAQRQTNCHPFLRHGTGMARDAWWQIYCRLDFDRPPRFDFSELDRDPFVVLGPESGARAEVIASPRIGITKAVDRPWRFSAAGSKFVSKPWPRRG